ncbi:hypothetical protein SISSUDRAFT_1042966 [Sistotremastrum suecicum HHB10207 ss-3]|uniref:Uncharacterized protein n=1 Tax=Sistotremastrum suecicum HHB10207 ss-3 TaxID=1314776 RepID=A0A166G7D5_9AGAM|nr:hypothetical protein SISSUDRAFT_1042966 [Sistotremastrum suecicum HHB10207 ss-3]
MSNNNPSTSANNTSESSDSSFSEQFLAQHFEENIWAPVHQPGQRVADSNAQGLPRANTARPRNPPSQRQTTTSPLATGYSQTSSSYPTSTGTADQTSASPPTQQDRESDAKIIDWLIAQIAGMQKFKHARTLQGTEWHQFTVDCISLYENRSATIWTIGPYPVWITKWHVLKALEAARIVQN